MKTQILKDWNASYSVQVIKEALLSVFNDPEFAEEVEKMKQLKQEDQ